MADKGNGYGTQAGGVTLALLYTRVSSDERRRG
jgi:hypothetical protein